MQGVKIATCCYCGTKAALVLRGKTHHELSCGSCGAPLQALKMLPNSGARVTAPAATPTRPTPKKLRQKSPRKKPSRPKKRKKTSQFTRRLWEEVWDVVEDIFD